jgi:regulator of protease activity HflC (stomatin/prohibitin superfamily)
MEINKRTIIAGFLGLLLILLPVSLTKVVEWVPADKIAICQHVNGHLSYWTVPGPKTQWFGDVITYDRTNQLWFSDSEGEGGERPTDLAIPVIFNDAGNGKISGSVRVKLPTGETQLQAIRTDYPTMNKLIYDLVRPTVVKVVYASGTLMSSFESYAEKKNDLIFYITDQLNNGVYKTQTTEVRVIDALSEEEKIQRVASLVADSLAPGGYARQERSPFNAYGIEVGQLSISSINYDERILRQIEEQQKAQMAVQTAKAQAIEARQQAIRAEEQGKATAMTAKWEQEKIKVVAVTQAQQEYEVASLEAKKAREVAERIIQEGRAEAEANRAKVSAGLTPQERAEWEYKTKVGVAAEISKIKLPAVVTSGGQGNGTLMDLMSLKFATDLVDKFNK